MKNIIEDLWYDNIDPQDEEVCNTPEMKQLLSYAMRHQDKLLLTLTEEQRREFEAFQDCIGDHTSLFAEAVFEYAFKLGAQMMVAVLKE